MGPTREQCLAFIDRQGTRLRLEAGRPKMFLPERRDKKSYLQPGHPVELTVETTVRGTDGIMVYSKYLHLRIKRL